MSGSEHARPVWLTEGDVENLCVPGFPEGARFLRSAWDAAPADPTEAVQGVLVERYGTVFEGTPSAQRFADDVLRALGCAKEPA